MPKYKVRSLKLSGLQLPGLDIISSLREYYSPTMTMRFSVYSLWSFKFALLITANPKDAEQSFFKSESNLFSQFCHIRRCNDARFDGF